MTDTFGNIPSHPLVVHVPIVLVPLSLLATLLMVVSPALRRRLASVVIVVLAIASVATIFAAQSGRDLEEKYIDAGRTIPDLLKSHAEMGNRLQYLVVLYLILTIAWVVRARRSGPTTRDDGSLSRRPQVVSAVVVLLAILAGATATVSTLRTGHTGARSVWEQIAPE